MTVSSVGSSVLDAISSQYSSAVTEDNNATLIMNDFITIFLAQLKYQDPLNPMEGTEMTSQLSQITTVEQLYSANEKLDVVSQELEELSSAGLLDYLGKDVLLEGNVLSVQDGETLGGIFFSIEEDATIEISIYDAEGYEIRQIQYGPAEAGSHQIEWDGMDNQGNPVEDGSFTYEVVATNENGVYVSVQTQSKLRVTGLTYESGSPYLLVGDLRIDPNGILCLYDPLGQTA